MRVVTRSDVVNTAAQVVANSVHSQEDGRATVHRCDTAVKIPEPEREAEALPPDHGDGEDHVISVRGVRLYSIPLP